MEGSEGVHKRQKATNVVLLEERFWVVVAVHIDLGHGIVHRGILAPALHTDLKPWHDELESVALFYLVNKLIDREVAGDGGEKALDRALVTVNVQKTTNDLRGSGRVDPLHVYLNELDEAVLIEIKNEVVDEVEAVADDDEGKLIGEFGLLEEVLDFLRVVMVALSADALDLPDLPSASGSLNVLEVHLGILADVHNRSKVVVET